jgi:hypothetical protein
LTREGKLVCNRLANINFQIKKSIELSVIASYPKDMKKLICLLLISWMPILMATANAMNLQMTSQSINADLQAPTSMPCHDEAKQQPVKHNCMSCGFCVITTYIVFSGATPRLSIPAFKSFKSSFIDDKLQSIHHSPAYRPPILN